MADTKTTEVVKSVSPEKDIPAIKTENTHKCPKCGNDVIPDTVFCENCGYMMKGSSDTTDSKDEKSEVEEKKENVIKSTISEKKEVSKKTHDAFHQMDDLG